MTTKYSCFRLRPVQGALVLAAAIFLLAMPAAAFDADSMPIRYECSGNEPFWNLLIDGRDASFSRMGSEGTVRQELQGHFRLLVYAGVFAWRGPLQGDPPGDAVVFVARQVCLDTMAESDEGGGAKDFGIGISLPGGEVLLGCCEGQAATRRATVLGEEIRAAEVAELQEILLSRLFDPFASDRDIGVTDAEVDRFVDKLKRGLAAKGLNAEDDLTPEEVLEVEAMRRQMAHSMIRRWKVNRALYKRYGGRLIYQQLGPEPLDAYRQFLEEREKAGDFEIYDDETKDAFWHYFVDESIHSFMEPGSPDASRAFESPTWESRDTAD